MDVLWNQFDQLYEMVRCCSIQTLLTSFTDGQQVNWESNNRLNHNKTKYRKEVRLGRVIVVLKNRFHRHCEDILSGGTRLLCSLLLQTLQSQMFISSTFPQVQKRICTVQDDLSDLRFSKSGVTPTSVMVSQVFLTKRRHI